MQYYHTYVALTRLRSMSLKLPAPDGHQELVVHTDHQVLWSDYPLEVVTATLDQHPCAARILHRRLRSNRLLPPASQVEQDYQIWRDLKHPNIVQLLGKVQDPRNNYPIILMELMKQSLAHFLNTSPTDIPYHVQVNISHDIALAVDYLHSNGIIHRDLTSNNILLNSHYQAKVAGFRMSLIVDSDSTLPRPHLGSAFFLPPEAFLSEPCYSDCFSVGVLVLCIAKRIDAGEIYRSMQSAPTAESMNYHRQFLMGKVPAFHGFLPVIRDCLKDKSEDRPSAGQLCQRLGQLKTTAAYRKSLTDPSFQVHT